MKTETNTMREEFRAELDRLKIIGFPKVFYKIELLNDSFNVRETFIFDSEKQMNEYEQKELRHVYPAFMRKTACIIL